MIQNIGRSELHFRKSGSKMASNTIRSIQSHGQNIIMQCRICKVDLLYVFGEFNKLEMNHNEHAEGAAGGHCIGNCPPKATPDTRIIRLTLSA